MDRATAILLGLTVATLALGYLVGEEGSKLPSAKARCLLTLAKIKASHARRAAIEFRDKEAEHLLVGAINLLRKVGSEAETDLNADDTIEAVSRTATETSGILRAHAEATVRTMDALRGETLRLTHHLETLRPDTGEYDDSDHATA